MAFCDLRKIGFSVAAAAACAVAAPANAQRINIDNGSDPFTACTIGSTCSALSFAGHFSPNFGFGPINGVYVYDNGLVSIGAEIAAGADLSSLASIGGNVFSAGYVPGMTLRDFEFQLPTPTAFTGSFLGVPVIRVRYLADFAGVTDMPMGFSIFDRGALGYTLEFGHGNGTIAPDMPANAYLGYSFGGSGVQVAGSAVPGNGLSTFQYTFVQQAVPEAGTWMMMIFGFGLLGGAMRRQRRSTTEAPALL